MATMALVMNNPEFKTLHTVNVKEKKLKKIKSIMKLCGKLARVLVGMARNGLEYIPEKVYPITEVAA
jgi:transposase